MQRSSPSIGTLAAALAKAQGELVNPEKSLVATIRAEGRGGKEQTFRYAPLSSGLDSVRKILGQHEIAICKQLDRPSRRHRRPHHGSGACVGRVVASGGRRAR